MGLQKILLFVAGQKAAKSILSAARLNAMVRAINAFVGLKVIGGSLQFGQDSAVLTIGPAGSAPVVLDVWINGTFRQMTVLGAVLPLPEA